MTGSILEPALVIFAVAASLPVFALTGRRLLAAIPGPGAIPHAGRR